MNFRQSRVFLANRLMDFVMIISIQPLMHVEVVKDDRKAGSKSYMWVYRTGEYYKDKPIV